MKYLKTKTTATLITAILILSITATMVLPIAEGHTPPWNKKTWVYVAVSPNPAQVNSPVLGTWWTDLLPQTALGAYGDRWKNVRVTITKPDGTTEELGPFTSDPVGGGYFIYTPTQTGTYRLQSHFPGHTYTGMPFPPQGESGLSGRAYINDTLEPSDSDIIELIVNNDPVPAYADTPLPTNYWTRPINGRNRLWAKIAGNWEGGVPYENAPVFPSNSINYGTTGPESAHVMWAKPIQIGGIADPNYGTGTYYDGLSYERYWVNPIIIAGRLYVSEMGPPRYGYTCYDLRTGEVIWFHNSTGPLLPNIGPSGTSHVPSGSYPYLSFGQIYDYESPNQHGPIPYLWSNYADPRNSSENVWQMLDANTGNWILNINHVPSGGAAFAPASQIRGKDGSLLIYSYSNNGGYMTLWNSSRCIIYKPVYTSNEFWEWRPTLGKTFNGNDGYEWNVTVPTGLGSISHIYEDMILGFYGQSTFAYGVNAYGYWSMSLKPENRGTLNWRKDYAAPELVNSTVYLGASSKEDGIFLEWVKETRSWTGYDINTGNKVWGPSASEGAYNMYGRGTNNAVIYQGKLLTYGYDGITRCYNVKTGDVLWSTPTETSTDSYFDSGRYPLNLGVVAEGKIYLYSSEHSPSKPLWRGSKLRCLSVETGVQLWAAEHWGNVPIIADGIIVDLNNYDGQMYAFGKGPSATTVTVQNDVVGKDSTILIKGTVTDQSAGAKGTPAIADESMEAWMDYIYRQQPLPLDATGVEVKIEALDPHGSYTTLGTTHSDASGNFAFMYKPSTEGMYTIVASFAGSKSYWPSSAETIIGVTSAAAYPGVSATPTPTGGVVPPGEPVPTTTYIAIAAVVIIIVAILAAVALRRRK